MSDLSRKFCQYKFIAGVKKGQVCDRFLRKDCESNLCYKHKTKQNPILIEKPKEQPKEEPKEQLKEEPTKTIIPKGKPIKLRNYKSELDTTINKDIIEHKEHKEQPTTIEKPKFIELKCDSYSSHSTNSSYYSSTDSSSDSSSD
jgi:hypothetical protein